MSKKTKAELMAALAEAGVRRDWDAANEAEAALERADTDPAPAGDTVAATTVAVIPPQHTEEIDPALLRANLESTRELGVISEEPLPARPAMIVGRSCLYRLNGEVMAGVICFDHGDGVVNLRVFPNSHHVPLVTGASYGYDSGQWSWID